MGLERRGNGTYYYSKKRSGRKVTSVYEGSGFAAQLEALEAQIEAEEEAEKRRQFEAEKAALDDVETMVSDACRSSRSIMKALFLANGYHTHKRQWRRRRAT
jgi:hypothetical protein